MMDNKTINEPSKDIPIIMETDVCIIGSGIAGSAAAISAARNNAKVTLIEKENCPGGLATLGLIFYYLPLCDGYGNKLTSGLAEELLKKSIKYGPGRISAVWRNNPNGKEGTRKRYMTLFNPASFMLSLEELLIDSQVGLLYDSRFCNVIKENKNITSVIIENKSGRCAVSCKTVVDASGDADVCLVSGENVVSSSDNMLSSWFFSYDKENLKRQVLGRWEGQPKGMKLYAGDNYKDVTEFNIESRKRILQRVLDNKKKHKIFYPIVLPALPQFRMTRRLNSNYVLSESDEKKYFEDTVGMVGDWKKAGPVYCIPFRSLIGVNTNNLIVAGRCISASGNAWDSTRAIGQCALTGEIAGTACALSLKNRSDVNKLNVRILQKKLIDQGNIIDKGLLVNQYN